MKKIVTLGFGILLLAAVSLLASCDTTSSNPMVGTTWVYELSAYGYTYDYTLDFTSETEVNYSLSMNDTTSSELSGTYTYDSSSASGVITFSDEDHDFTVASDGASLVYGSITYQLQ